MDPVADFAELAERDGIFLHVDAAFGGFILPFMRDLGHEVPEFDFTLPGVSSMMTDGHKLGLLPVPTSFFLLRDPALLDAIPTEDTLIHTLSSTKPGANAAAAWATFTHLGREGYRAHIRHLLQVRDRVVEAIEEIDGLRLVVAPFISIVTFTSDSHDLRTLYELMRTAGWGMTMHGFHGEEHLRLSIHPQRTLASATAFGEALAAAGREARRAVL
jgi:tyrosine decarboxylase/aspartate 1-decarboxylase